MNRIGLATYTIRVREQQDLKSYHVLDSLFGSHDLLAHIKEWLSTLEKTPQKFDSVKKHLELESLIPKVEPRQVAGFLEAGDFGLLRPVKKAGKKPVHGSIGLDDTIPVPIYFNFMIPSNSLVGYLVVESYGGQRVKGLLQLLLDGHIRSNVNNSAVLEMKHFVTGERLIALVKKSNIAEVRLYRKGLSNSVARQVGNKNKNKPLLAAQAGKMALVVQPSGYDVSKLKSRIGAVINNKIKPGDLLEADFDHGGDTDAKAKVVLDYNGTRRVLSLNNWEGFYLDHDATKEVGVSEENGLPNRIGLHFVGNNLMAEAMESGLA